jgi:hypothetical protein
MRRHLTQTFAIALINEKLRLRERQLSGADFGATNDGSWPGSDYAPPHTASGFGSPQGSETAN